MKGFLIFIRFGMLPPTMSVSLLGYWSCLNGTGEICTIFFLLLTGAAAHIFGFGLNDIVDLSIDKQVDYRKNSPLVAGKMPIKLAWVIVLLQIPLMFLFYHLGAKTERKIWGNLFILMSILLSVVYNFFSKKGLVKRWIAELALALSISFLCLAGSYIYNYEIKLPSILFSTSIGLVLLSINSLGSGLKDLKTDLKAGGKSFVIENGARMIGEDQIFISKKLKIYGYVVQALMLANFVYYLWAVNSITFLSISFLSFSIFGLLHLQHLISQKTFTSLNKKGPLLYGYLNFISLVFLEFKVLPIIFLIIMLLIGIQVVFIYFRLKYMP